MKIKPLVSVIVPIYKTEDYLSRCVESIRNQSYTKLEIILVDDGSPDKCPEICDNFAKMDQRIKVIHKQNGGISSARNAGLNVIVGNYVTFIGSNDFIYKDYIKTLIFLCLKYNSEIAACSLYYGNDSNFKHVSGKSRIYAYKKTDAFMSRKIKPGIDGKLFKTTLFINERFPLSDYLNYEDEALTYKLIYKSNQVVITDKKMYCYYQSPVSATRNSNLYKETDFINVFEDRINFFEYREIGLRELSWEYYCLNLMFFYSSCKKDKQNINNKKEILGHYKKAYKKVMQNQSTPITYKIMFTAFNLAPSKCAFAVNKLHLR